MKPKSKPKQKKRRSSSSMKQRDSKPKTPELRYFPGTPLMDILEQNALKDIEDIELPPAASATDDEEGYELWRSEVDILSATHKDKVKHKGGPSTRPQSLLFLHMEPFTTSEAECSIDIKLGYKKGYPGKPPLLRIVKAPNMKGSVVDIIQDVICKKANKLAKSQSKSSEQRTGFLSNIIEAVQEMLNEYQRTSTVTASPLSHEEDKATNSAPPLEADKDSSSLVEYMKTAVEKMEKRKVGIGSG